MADIGVPRNWLVSPTKEIEDMWIDVQIQEKKSRIVRHRQDIEDLQKGKLTELNAIIKMLEMEVKELEQKKAVDIKIE
jgi:hypothetical protein